MTLTGFKNGFARLNHFGVILTFAWFRTERHRQVRRTHVNGTNAGHLQNLVEIGNRFTRFDLRDDQRLIIGVIMIIAAAMGRLRIPRSVWTTVRAGLAAAILSIQAASNGTPMAKYRRALARPTICRGLGSHALGRAPGSCHAQAAGSRPSG